MRYTNSYDPVADNIYEEPRISVPRIHEVSRVVELKAFPAREGFRECAHLFRFTRFGLEFQSELWDHCFGFWCRSPPNPEKCHRNTKTDHENRQNGNAIGQGTTFRTILVPTRKDSFLCWGRPESARTRDPQFHSVSHLGQRLHQLSSR